MSRLTAKRARLLLNNLPLQHVNKLAVLITQSTNHTPTQQALLEFCTFLTEYYPLMGEKEINTHMQVLLTTEHPLWYMGFLNQLPPKRHTKEIVSELNTFFVKVNSFSNLPVSLGQLKRAMDRWDE